MLAVFLILAQGIFYGCLATYINYLQICLMMAAVSCACYFTIGVVTKWKAGGREEFKQRSEPMFYFFGIALIILFVLCVMWMVMFHTGKKDSSAIVIFLCCICSLFATYGPLTAFYLVKEVAPTIESRVDFIRAAILIQMRLPYYLMYSKINIPRVPDCPLFEDAPQV